MGRDIRTHCHREGGCIRAFDDETCGDEGQCSIVLDIAANPMSNPVSDASVVMAANIRGCDYCINGCNDAQRRQCDDRAIVATYRSTFAAKQKAPTPAAPASVGDDLVERYAINFPMMRLDFDPHGPLVRYGDYAEAASQLAALTAENTKWQGRFWKMDANFDRANARATTAEAQLKAAREALQQAFDFLGGIDGAVEVRAAVAAALIDARVMNSAVSPMGRAPALSRSSNCWSESSFPGSSRRRAKDPPPHYGAAGEKCDSDVDLVRPACGPYGAARRCRRR